MPSDLEELIDYYQREKQRLQLSIEENKRDMDFIAVHQNYKELGYIQRELDSLLELKNPNYPKIKRLEWQIELYSKKNERFPEISDLNKQMVNQSKKELEEIKRKKVPTTSDESQHVDEALYSLLNNDIKAFVLYLDLKMGTRIDFTKKEENHIQISIPVEDENDARHLKKYTLIGDLDMNFHEQSNCLTKEFDVGPNKDVLPIKEVVSRIVIGSKGFLRSGGEIFLKLKP
ncbi:hypothetical protein [Flagellimonas sp. GZD32]|uniref:hypothetical protein n=1 Tax=Flagellimonas cixiensis TaxID=3228750 RepID=UPI0035C91F31